MKRRRKSQAALEFLTTYGWAFIVILATIGAMTYFGVIDPKKFIPDRCMFGTDFECKDYQLSIQANGYHRADFILVNSLGETIAVTGATCTFPNGATAPATLANLSLPTGWHSGTTQALTCFVWNNLPNQGGLIKKEKQKVKVSFTYALGSQGFPHLAEGEIFSTVQEIP